MIAEQIQICLYEVSKVEYQHLDLPFRRVPHWILSYVQQGHVCISAKGEESLAQTGCVMLHPANEPFREWAHTPGVHWWCTFDAMIGTNSDFLRRYPAPRVIALPNPLVFEQVFARLESTWQAEASAWRDARAVALILELIDVVLEPIQKTPSDHGVPERFTRVIAHMKNNLQNPLNRSVLAELANLHPTHFDRVFRARYGVSPMTMLRDLRLRQVCQRLERSDDTLEVIAADCGFQSAAYLSRVFQATFKQSCGQYRRMLKAAQAGYGA